MFDFREALVGAIQEQTDRIGEIIREKFEPIFFSIGYETLAGKPGLRITIVATAFDGLSSSRRQRLVDKDLRRRLRGLQFTEGPVVFELRAPNERSEKSTILRLEPRIGLARLVFWSALLSASYGVIVVAVLEMAPRHFGLSTVAFLLLLLGLLIVGAVAVPIVSFEIAKSSRKFKRSARRIWAHADDVRAQRADDAVATALLARLSRGTAPVRDFCLYLRPFFFDRETTVQSAQNVDEASVEEMLVEALRGRCDVVSLGRGGGVGRPGTVDAGDDGWRSAFGLLASHASLIVMVPILQPATAWEFEQIQVRGLLGKTVFLLPPLETINREAWDPLAREASSVSASLSERGIIVDHDEEGQGSIFRVHRTGSTQRCYPFPNSVAAMRRDLATLYPDLLI